MTLLVIADDEAFLNKLPEVQTEAFGSSYAREARQTVRGAARFA
jgi:hypothetical protein